MCNRTEVLLRIQQRKGRNFNVKEEELMRKIGKWPVQEGYSPPLAFEVPRTSRVH